MTVTHPRVTLILAVRNEAAHIARCVASVLSQDYPVDRLEILLVDGDSDDDTVDIVRRMDGPGRVRILENPLREMPYALNLGVEASSGDYIGSVIGHSVIPPDYVTRCVEAMERTGAWAVGGRYVRRGETSVQKAIARVTSHPLGVGDSRHNYATTAGWVETAFPGFWRREVFERVGLFDPLMVVNEDNELALRIHRAGGRIWYEPSIGVDYFPRASLSGLFHQYRRYAMGKVAVFRKHRTGIRWRHLVPGGWLGLVVAGPVVGLVLPLTAVVWLVLLLVYLASVTVVSFRVTDESVRWWIVAAAFVTVHLAYGTGTWQGLLLWAVRRGPLNRLP